MKEGMTMKKSTIAITASMILIGLASSAYAGEILGYPIVAKQAKFYSIILGVIAASMAMVAISYFCFWLSDVRKREKVSKPLGKAAFAGELVAAAQSAK
jgi:mannitol-specific phosphotransferase system IIBC component